LVIGATSQMSGSSLIPDLSRDDLPNLGRSRQGEARADEREESGSPATIRVMVLADVRLYREGLAHLLAAEPRLTVVAAGPVSAASLLCVRAEHVDVILLEAATACETRLIEELTRLAPETKVVAYGLLDEDRQALECVEAGAAAFVTGEATEEQLVSAIFAVGRGELNCSPRVAGLLVKRVRSLAQGMAPVGKHARLTRREHGIVALIDEGLSNKQIAARLGIELCTVKNHVHHILEKLEVTRRGQAAANLRCARLLGSTVQSSPGPGS
jgi:two-component system nitrate/nitrite response regulator NarL